MANNSNENNKPNNLGKKGKTPYKVTYGIFEQIEKNKEKQGDSTYVLNLPPENSKEYKDLLKSLEIAEMTLKASSYTKVLDKNGKVKARIDDKTGKELVGDVKIKDKTGKLSAIKNNEASIGE